MYNICAWILLAASLINSLFILYACRQGNNRKGVFLYSGGVLCSILYAAGYAFELMSENLYQVNCWLHVQYLGIVFVPVFWLLLVCHYTKAKVLKKRWVRMLLYIFPLLILLAQYTNEMHHLFYRSMYLVHTADMTITVTEKGILYWINLTYMYITLLYGDYLLLKIYPKVAGSYRWQLRGLLIGSFFPYMGNALYLLGLSPEHIDLSPFMIAVSTPIYGWSLFYFQMLDLVPIARDRIFENMYDAVVVTDVYGRLVDYNKAAKRVFPVLSAMHLGNSLEELHFLPEFLITEERQPAEFEISLDTEGRICDYYVRSSLVNSNRGIPMGRIFSLHDVSEKVQLVRQLKYLAMIDETTQIYNRRNFMRKSEFLYEKARKEQQTMLMILFDIDYFKRVNDTYGHAAGDHALYTAAQTCLALLPTDAVFGRYGGEEFCCCMTGISLEQGCRMAEIMKNSLEKTKLQEGGNEFCITASFGIAFAKNAQKTTVADLLKEADQGMYQAKNAGRNRVVVYSAD